MSIFVLEMRGVNGYQMLQLADYLMTVLVEKTTRNPERIVLLRSWGPRMLHYFE